MAKKEFAFEDVYGDMSIRESDNKNIIRDSEAQTQIINLKKIEQFLAEFIYLTFGRDFVLIPSSKVLVCCAQHQP